MTKIPHPNKICKFHLKSNMNDKPIFGFCVSCEELEDLYKCRDCQHFRCYSCLDTDDSTCEDCTELVIFKCYYCDRTYESSKERRFFTVKRTACRICIKEWDPFVCLACGCNINKMEWDLKLTCSLCNETRCINCMLNSELLKLLFHCTDLETSEELLCLYCHESLHKHFS